MEGGIFDQLFHAPVLNPNELHVVEQGLVLQAKVLELLRVLVEQNDDPRVLANVSERPDEGQKDV